MATSKTPATSTAVAVKKSNSVVSIKDQLAAQAAAMADRTAPASGNKIKLAPNQMTLPDGTKTPGPLELVVVDFISRNQWWPEAYDQNNITPPGCFAIGTNPLKLEPSPNSPEPQATSCAVCPKNAFGSAANGSGKACKNERLLAVLPPDGDADTPLWALSVGPTSTKGFDGYVTGVVRTFQTPPVGVITTVSLDDTKTYAATLFGEAMPNPKLTEHFARQAEAQAMLTVEPDVSTYGQAKVPAKKAAPARPAARR